MNILSSGKIFDQWSTLIEQCQGEAEGFFRVVEQNLKQHEAPGLSWRRESVAPGWLKGLMGKRRDFLLLRHLSFNDYVMCVGARDYGTNLDVSWYLVTSEMGAFLSALAKVPGLNLVIGLFARVRGLDVFDQQDLNAYVTVGHHAVRQAVEQLIETKKLDGSRVEWKSRGGLL